MDYKWEQFGDEIKQSVQDAVERGDFSRLNQTVNDSVSRAADAISRGMKNGGWYRDPKANGGRNPDPKMNSGRNPDPGMAGSRNGADAPWNRGGQQNVRPQYPAQSQVRYLKGTSEKIGGVFLAVTGGVFGTVTLAATIIMLVMLAVTTAEAATIAGTLICVFFFLIFAGMFGKGIGMVSLVSRFRSYVKVIGEREFCDLGELATRTGRDLKKILKDVKKMIGKGWFRQGHLDENEKCLIVSEDAWNQYRSTMENIHRQQQERPCIGSNDGERHFQNFLRRGHKNTDVKIRARHAERRPEQAEKRRRAQRQPKSLPDPSAFARAEVHGNDGLRRLPDAVRTALNKDADLNDRAIPRYFMI